jgi:hypothetical protein
MIKKVLLFALIFVFLISLVLAFDSCQCVELCEEELLCSLGDCSKQELLKLNCTNDGVLADNCSFCPACVIHPDCLDGNKFLSDADHSYCVSYYDTILVADPKCKVTVDFNISSEGTELTDANIAVISLIDGIDYQDYYDYKYSRMSESDGHFSVARCRGEERMTVVASKSGYDADVASINISADNKVSLELFNFELARGVCHTDCTDSYNRCNPECQGFSNDTDTCDFLESGTDLTQLCAYKTKGTQVVLEVQEGIYTTMDCCRGAGGTQTVSRPQSNINLVTNQNLVSVTKLVNVNDETGKLSVYYWD